MDHIQVPSISHHMSYLFETSDNSHCCHLLLLTYSASQYKGVLLLRDNIGAGQDNTEKQPQYE